MLHTVMRAAVACCLLSVLGTSAAGAQTVGKWEKLGERQIDVSRDRDTIQVGRDDGTFRQIKLNVKRNAITVERLTVVYANGANDDIPMGYVIHPATDSRVIDLKGSSRYIRRVEMVLRTVRNGRGKAVVALWGRK
ncbi:MAG: hypothetical protein ACOYLK_11560 [Sphingomonas sp.]|jgi:hypothetical protein